MVTFPDGGAVQVFRDYEQDGNPVSGEHDPAKTEIRELLTAYETAITTLQGATGNADAIATILAAFANKADKGTDVATGARAYTVSVSIAAGATINLATATGDYVPITGAGATVTSLGAVTAGIERLLVFGGVNTITHNAASLILPGGKSITTDAGDVMTVRSLGSGNWICTGYQSSTGRPVNEYYPLTKRALAVSAGMGWIADLIVFDVPDGQIPYVRFMGWHNSGNNALFQVNVANPDGSSDAILGQYTSANDTTEGFRLIPLSTGGRINALLILTIPTGATSSSSAGSVTTSFVLPDRRVSGAAWTEYLRRTIAGQHEYGFFENPPAGTARTRLDVCAKYIKNIKVLCSSATYEQFFVQQLVYTPPTASVAGSLLIQINAVNGAGSDIVARLSSVLAAGTTPYSGRVTFAVPAYFGAATAEVTLEFETTPTAFSAAGGSYLECGLKRDVIIGASSWSAWVLKVISDAAAAGGVTTPGNKKPFIDTAAQSTGNDAARKLVRGVRIYNVGKSDQWIVERIYAVFGTGGYVRAWLKRLSDGLVLAQTILNVTLADAIATASTLKVYPQGASTNDAGPWAELDLDWNAIPSGTNYIYTAYTDTGIHKDCLFTTEQTALLMGNLSVGTKWAIGTGKDYDTLTLFVAALERYYGSGGPNSGSQSYRGVSDKISPTNAAHVLLMDPAGSPVSLIGRTFDIVHEMTGAVGNRLHEGTILSGASQDRVLIKPAAGTTDHTLQVNVSTVVENVTVSSEGASYYAIHCDPAASAMPDKEGREHRITFRDVRGVTGAAGTRPSFGCGVYGGEVLTLENCEALALNPSGTDGSFLFHNTTNGNRKPPVVRLKHCSGNQPVVVQGLGNGVKGVLTIEGGKYPLIRQDNLGDIAIRAVDRREWSLLGQYDGPVSQFDANMQVLAAASGTFGGTAAAAVVGTVDEFGRGEIAAYAGGPSIALGLGDCTTVNKTLTLGAQSIAFAENYTSIITATIAANSNSMVVTAVAGRPLETGMVVWVRDMSGATGARKIMTAPGGGGAGTYTLSSPINSTSAIAGTVFGAVDNAVITAAIIAAMTANPVSLVNISMEDYPALGQTIRLYNNSGATIGDPVSAGPGRGVFVKQTGALTIAAAADGDDVFGFAARPIANNAWGTVVTGKRVYCGYVAGAHSLSAGAIVPVTGRFGVGAGGVLSAGAATKIGVVTADGTLRLF